MRGREKNLSLTSLCQRLQLYLNLIDKASEVTRLNSASHCIDSYLKVSRPLNYLLTSVPICIWLRSPVVYVSVKESSPQWWRGGGSVTPRGTCFPCALVQLPIFSNGAQQGGMNRFESSCATA